MDQIKGDVKISKTKGGIPQMTYKRRVANFNEFVKAPDKFTTPTSAPIGKTKSVSGDKDIKGFIVENKEIAGITIGIKKDGAIVFEIPKDMEREDIVKWFSMKENMNELAKLSDELKKKINNKAKQINEDLSVTLDTLIHAWDWLYTNFFSGPSLISGTSRTEVASALAATLGGFAATAMYVWYSAKGKAKELGDSLKAWKDKVKEAKIKIDNDEGVAYKLVKKAWQSTASETDDNVRVKKALVELEKLAKGSEATEEKSGAEEEKEKAKS